MSESNLPSIYYSADSPVPHDPNWIEQHWLETRLRLSDSKSSDFFLIFDEIQKIKGWSEVVKKCFDEDRFAKRRIIPVLLGSSKTAIQEGLTESLAGRFEQMLIPHWSFNEMHEAFGFTLEQFSYFGGFPGSAHLINDEERWKNYIRDSLIETIISRDILLNSRVDKPILLRNLFKIGMSHSTEVVSYQKMLGQLQDAGNATTLANYLVLLGNVMVLTGLEKFSGNEIRKKKSSPKFAPYNTAFKSAISVESFMEVKSDSAKWGRWVESAVCAELLNASTQVGFEIYYWSNENCELDYVLKKGSVLVGIEVKSGTHKDKLSGVNEFKKIYPDSKILVVGQGGLELLTFFKMDKSLLFKI
jgi:predicted AAA+ superfamily ATPase